MSSDEAVSETVCLVEAMVFDGVRLKVTGRPHSEILTNRHLYQYVIYTIEMAVKFIYRQLKNVFPFRS